MWIMDQRRQLMVNTDNVSHIFIDRSAAAIKARLLKSSDTDTIVLGIYDSNKIDKVMNDIYIKILNKNKAHTMPLRGEA